MRSAVFQQFSHVVFRARRQFVVLDTAPTGHTLLLLDATGSYHREITRQMSEGAHFVTPLMRLQDPAQTKVVIVTLPETTPVLEAEELQDDLGPSRHHAVGLGRQRQPHRVRADLAVPAARAHAEAGPLARVKRALRPRGVLAAAGPRARRHSRPVRAHRTHQTRHGRNPDRCALTASAAHTTTTGSCRI